MALKPCPGEEQQQAEEAGGGPIKILKSTVGAEINLNDTLTLSVVGAFDARAISMNNLVKA